jgi:cytochrome c-type biogenesis protein CcmH/NrfG
MKHIKVMASVVCMAALAACELGGVRQANVTPIEKALGDADNMLRAGQTEQAITVLEKAAADHPTDKAPLLRIAQMRFDQGDYGSAIVHANGALKREPDNLLASSIVAVSGLRVASKALAELSTRNNLTGNVKDEAEDLAKLLRGALGQPDLVPVATRQSAGPRLRTTPSTPPPRPSSDPFINLK